MRRTVTGVIVVLSMVVVGSSATADIVSPLTATIDFNEYPFPTPTQIVQGPGGSSSVSYNLFDDATGTELVSDNGDLDDITITYTTSAPGNLGVAGRPSLEINPTTANQITGRTGYEGAVAANNPGTRQSYSTEVTFASHLDITDVTIDTSSLNTAGISWEFTVVSFLDTSGSPFGPTPTIDPYLAFEPGLTGPSGTGHFLAAETGTVMGVGTDLTASGTSGSHDQANDTISNADVTLPGSPLLGGFILNTTLEDVRGVNNGDTNFSSSIRQIDISGTITQTTSDADVSISKSGDVVDDQVVYEVTVSNDGPDGATSVVVTDVLPPEVAYVSDDCGANNLPPWTWQVGTVLAGDSITCTITTQIVQHGVIENEATVTADEDDPNPDTNTAIAVLDTTSTQTPTTTTTTAPATTTTPPTTTTTETPVTLPFTGSGPTGPLTALAAVLIAAGVLIIALRRERTHSSSRG